MNLSSKVPAAFNGLSVLDYLATRFTYLSAENWLQLIEEGRITRAGICCSAGNIVNGGDNIGCDLPDFAAPVVNLDYQIIHRDNWLLGINKPPGLRVHSGGKFVTANLMYHLRQVHQPAYPEANPVHRLDADTSGLILLARDKKVLIHLTEQFRKGLIEKRYLAVVEGMPCPPSGTISLPLGPVKNARVPRFAVDLTTGKPAVTHYSTLRTLSANYSLVELRPETGRTHQLRVHLAAIGHPIAGDRLYTMNDSDYLDWRHNPPQAGLQRQALHSHQLQFHHPVQRTTCTLTAPLALDIKQFMHALPEAGRQGL